MKYLIISDSHQNNKDLLYLIDKYKDYELIHLGDKSLDINGINIKGNCDFKGIDELVINVDNKKWFLTHGHLYDVKYNDLKLYYRCVELNVDVCLFGHTHKKTDFIVDNIRFINPGALKDGYYILYDKEFKFMKL